MIIPGRIDNKLYIYSYYKDAQQYLSDTYLKEIENLRLTDPIKYDNQYLGKWLENNDKAVLSKELLNLALEKVEVEGEFDRIVVAIDPAVSTNKNSDNTRICSLPERKIKIIILYIQKRLKPHLKNGLIKQKIYILNIKLTLLSMRIINGRRNG